MENYGWICPRCGRVNAPWVLYCNCNKDDISYPNWWRDNWWKEPYCCRDNPNATTTTTTTTSLKYNGNTNRSTQTDNTYCS